MYRDASADRASARATSRVLFPLYAEPSAAADGVMSATMVPRRAHNELLERLAETGPLGLAALVALFVTAFGAALAARGRRGARGPAASPSADVDAASAAARAASRPASVAA